MKSRFILLVALVLLGACNSTDNQQQTLTIFAASSLTNAFEELASEFEAKNEQVDVVLNFAASSTLATQILEGAQADVFASANPTQMDKVQAAGHTVGEPQLFAYNRLVVAVYRESPVTNLNDLTMEGISIVLAAPEVPVREYTNAALDALAQAPSYGPAFRDAVLDNLVSEEANVRAVVLKVALGEADAGIVYATDVTPDITDTVRVISIPDEYNVVATYPIAATSTTPLAQDFIAFVMSGEGQTILAKWGFASN